MTFDSQTLESVVLGKVHPNKLNVRVKTEVPLRCMPATKTADCAAATSRNAMRLGSRCRAVHLLSHPCLMPHAATQEAPS